MASHLASMPGKPMRTTNTTFNAKSHRVRVVLVDENQTTLDSLHRWLGLTQAVDIVGKLSTPLTTLSSWDSLRPDGIVLSIPHTDEASIASANTVHAIKSIYPHVKIILLAWNLPAMGPHSLVNFVKVVDAWVFKQTVCEDLLPALAALFPNRVPLPDRNLRRVPCTAVMSTGKE